MPRSKRVGDDVQLATCEGDARESNEALARSLGVADRVTFAAGINSGTPFLEITEEEWHRVTSINLTGVFLLLRALLPAMRRQGSGWIFPILSTAAQRGFPGWSAYCASKWGLAGLVAALREELRGSGVRLTALYPGATASPLWDDLPGEWNRALMVPPREVARAVVHALDADPTTLVEEIHLGPAGGAL